MREIATAAPSGVLERARDAERQGRLEVARTWYRCALQEGRAAGASRAEILRWIGGTHRAEGSRDEALRAFRASLSSARAAGRDGDVAHALNWIGIVAQEGGRLTRADWLFDLARGIADDAGDGLLVAMVDQNLGINASIRGDLPTAMGRYFGALREYRRLGETGYVAQLLNVLGMLYVDMRLWGPAAEVLEESEQLCRESGDGRTFLMVLLNQGELALERARLVAAREVLDRAMEVAHGLNQPETQAEVHKLTGTLHQRMGDPVAAEWHLLRATALAERYANPLVLGEAQRELAQVYRDQHRNREALQALIRARRVFKELSAQRDLAKVEERAQELESLFLKIVEEWGESIESKDLYTAGHCRRVAGFATALAREVGFEDAALAWFRMGALLHDVGKVAVPQSILNKPGALTDDERRLMQQHTVVGADIVAELGFPWDITPMVRGHHECWDGGGYPDGLRGAEIPLAARILCIADVYDALTTTRSYRTAHTPDDALRIMASEVGTRLDPRLFDEFRAIVERDLARDLALDAPRNAPGGVALDAVA